MRQLARTNIPSQVTSGLAGNWPKVNGFPYCTNQKVIDFLPAIIQIILQVLSLPLVNCIKTTTLIQPQVIATHDASRVDLRKLNYNFHSSRQSPSP
jgi:hypothetical protein